MQKNLRQSGRNKDFLIFSPDYSGCFQPNQITVYPIVLCGCMYNIVRCSAGKEGQTLGLTWSAMVPGPSWSY